MQSPDWWEFVVLALALFRVYRLIAEDTILDRPRAWVLGVPGWKPTGHETPPDGYREHLAIFLTCAYCLGWWLSVVVWALWLIFPTETVALAVPFALSGAVALIASRLAD